MALALPFLVGMLVLVQRFYLRTSRQLRLLEYVFSALKILQFDHHASAQFSKLTNH
jgi:hypothetical protein